MKNLTRFCVTWACVGFLFSATNGYSMGHGEPLAIEKFVTKSRTVWVSIVSENNIPENFYSIYEIGAGKKFVVTDGKVKGSLKSVQVQWKPGYVLAYFEGHPLSATVTGELEEEGKSIALLSAEKYQHLQKDPYVFVNAISPQLQARSVNVMSSGGNSVFGGLTAFDISDKIEINKDRLIQNLNWLTGVEPAEVGGSPQTIPERGSNESRKLTQQALVEAFQRAGLEAEVKCYNQSRYTGCNVEATLWGADRSKFVLFTSHLDSVRNKGADDNGTGTGALLEVSRAFAAKSPAVSYRFVAFDQEELGLIGSRAYTKALVEADKEAIVAVINADMLGFDSDNDNAFHFMDCGRKDSTGISELAESISQELALGLKKVDACTNRSDHASFWEKNIPAVIVSESFFGRDGNSCYHRACDQINLVNVPYYHKLVTLMANVGWHLGQTRE
jgi:hypothetical protein